MYTEFGQHFELLYSGKVWQGKSLANLLGLSIWQKKLGK